LMSDGSKERAVGTTAEGDDDTLQATQLGAERVELFVERGS
jgi:hypothetical protein